MFRIPQSKYTSGAGEVATLFPGGRQEKEMVGAVRFELTTSCTRNKRASQATLRPDAVKKLPVVNTDCNADFAARHFEL